MKKARKWLATLLAVCLVVCGMPLSALADQTAQIGQGQESVISTNGYYTGIIDPNDTLWVWGGSIYNDYQIGNGMQSGSLVPAKVLDNVASFVRSSEYANGENAAITMDGSLFLWGDENRHGQLGVGTAEDVSTATKVLDHVDSVAFGRIHTAAVKADGTLWMWGGANYDKCALLGLGERPGSASPLKVMNDVQSVSCGENYTLALKNDGSLLSWGNGGEAMGHGSTVHTYYPVKIMDNVRFATAGYRVSAAIKNDGSLWLWGSNDCGALGVNANGRSSSPIKVMDSVSNVAIYRDTFHPVVAAIQEDGSLWMWGANDSGQIGNGTVNDVYAPVKILDDVKKVSLGRSHTAAVKNDGSLWLWGSNYKGQLGNNNAGIDSYQPIKIMDSVVDVAVHQNSTFIIKTDATVWVCGGNTYQGELGLGPDMTTDQHVPVQNPYITARIEGGTPVITPSPTPTVTPSPLPTSDPTPQIITDSLQSVPDGVINVPYQVIIQTTLGENISKSHELVVETGELPQGLVLGADGELHGIPSQAGEYEFTVALKVLSSQDTTDKRSYKIIVKESTPENVAEVNTSSQGYPLLDPLPDVIDFDKVESGAKFTFRSEGPFNELDAVYIDGDELTRGVDYTASDGSCVIALNDMGYGGRTAGRHVISVTFKKPSTQGNFTIKKTAQVVTFENPKPRPIPKYRISLNIDRNGGGTVLVSNQTAEAGKTITVTTRPKYGWEINQVTAGSAKITKNGDKYTFTMPNSAVTVKVSFKRIGAAEGTGMPFFDVHTTDWFYKPAKVAYDAGLMKGTASNAFSPNHPALRAMIATILYRHAGSPSIDEACPFTDVKAGTYYEKAVIWAKQNWVIDGTSATKFSPSEKITREQLVTMLHRYAGTPKGSGNLSVFTDIDKLSGYATDAMSWAVGNGIVTGKGNNLLDPKGNATRAEIAAVLQRFMDL